MICRSASEEERVSNLTPTLAYCMPGRVVPRSFGRVVPDRPLRPSMRSENRFFTCRPPNPVNPNNIVVGERGGGVVGDGLERGIKVCFAGQARLSLVGNRWRPSLPWWKFPSGEFQCAPPPDVQYPLESRERPMRLARQPLLGHCQDAHDPICSSWHGTIITGTGRRV